jgi:hypothetical protein
MADELNPELIKNPADSPSESLIIPDDKDNESDSQKAQEHLFFNVMPKAKAEASMVEPTLALESYSKKDAPGEKTNLSTKSLWGKYKLYIILALIIVILGPTAYFVSGIIVSSTSKPQNILVASPHVQQQPAPPQTTAPQATSTAEVLSYTTSSEWQNKYFPGCNDATLCGDNADPADDGLTNLEDYKFGLDPNNPNPSQSGLADGDEIYVFGANPLNSHSAGNAKYSDLDFIKGGFDLKTNKKLTPDQIIAITAKMQKFGLHEPTVTTLGAILNSIYNFSSPLASSTPAAAATLNSSTSTSATGTIDTLSAKQTRDAQRSDTITNIEIALIGYQAMNQTYPLTNSFATMFAAVKPYLKVATNPTDPLNQSPYVYSYASNASGSDFSLSFYSEVAGQPITKNAAEAASDSKTQAASIFDNQRETDLDSLRSALLLYSSANVAGTQTYVFPSSAQYQSALVPTYILAIPKDPETGKDYAYQVSSTYNSFTLKAALDNPAPGTTGWMCNQDGCQSY